MDFKKKFIYFPIIFFFLIFSHIYIYSDGIPKLVVIIDNHIKNTLTKLSNMPNSLILSPGDIEYELEDRYYEVWLADKSEWPICIRKVFDNLKKYDKIEIEWKLEPRLRTPYYQGDYDVDGGFRLVPSCLAPFLVIIGAQFRSDRSRICSLTLKSIKKGV